MTNYIACTLKLCYAYCVYVCARVCVCVCVFVSLGQCLGQQLCGEQDELLSISQAAQRILCRNIKGGATVSPTPLGLKHYFCVSSVNLRKRQHCLVYQHTHAYTHRHKYAQTQKVMLLDPFYDKASVFLHSKHALSSLDCPYLLEYPILDRLGVV